MKISFTPLEMEKAMQEWVDKHMDALGGNVVSVSFTSMRFEVETEPPKENK